MMGSFGVGPDPCHGLGSVSKDQIARRVGVKPALRDVMSSCRASFGLKCPLWWTFLGLEDTESPFLKAFGLKNRGNQTMLTGTSSQEAVDGPVSDETSGNTWVWVRPITRLRIDSTRSFLPPHLSGAASSRANREFKAASRTICDSSRPSSGKSCSDTKRSPGDLNGGRAWPPPRSPTGSGYKRPPRRRCIRGHRAAPAAG